MTEPAKGILWERQGDVTIVRFAADTITESDLSQAYEGLRKLAEEIGGRMVFSLANVEFISSAGISALLWLSEHLKSRKGELRICDVKPPVYEVFTIGRLHKILGFFDTLKDAMAGWGGEPPKGK